MMEHEGTHIIQALAFNPRICAGSVDGIALKYSSDREQNVSETAAWTVQLKCLEEKKKNNTCSTCASYINNEIDQAHKMLGGYRRTWNYDKDH